MHALQLTRSSPSHPPTLTLTTVPTPTPPPSHLLIRIYASAIHPSDLLNSRGLFPSTTYPRIPGRDFSGTIIAAPSTPSRIGEHVYGTSGNTQAFTVDGAHAEFIVVREDAVAKKPGNLTFQQAAVVGVPFTTAGLVLRRARVVKGETVLVLGARGAVGGAVVQAAECMRCMVIKGVRGEGGDVDTAKDGELSAIDELTGGKGVDVVVDTVGQPALTRAAVQKLTRGGRLAMIAAPRTGSTELGLDMVDFYRKEKTLVGCNSLLYSTQEFAKELEELTPRFEDGSLKGAGEGEWTPVKLEDAVAAYEKAGQKGAGKFVIVVK